MKTLKKAILTIFIIGVACGAFAMALNLMVVLSVDENIITMEEAGALPDDVDCIVVLGAGVREDGPSPMLRDRINTGVEVYNVGGAQKIIMSGDHGRKDYDEVNVMKDEAKALGVPSSDIFMDHAGFSTYESIYRAKEIFGADKIIIVTQKYHLYRALYIAEALGVEAYGVPADVRSYRGATYREVREVLARNKDYFMCIFKPEPTYLGEAIPVWGDGDVTNDK